MRMLREGDPTGSVWRPGETDVSIRPGWFYHPAEDARVKSVDRLVEIYFTSVGRNSKLLLNVPPTPDGLLHDVDVDRLRGMRSRLDALFANEVAGAGTHRWDTRRSRTLDVALPAAVTVSITDLREQISRGQAVSQYALFGSDGGEWIRLARGTTIGYRKLDRVEPVTVTRLRLTIQETDGPPAQVELRAYAAS
jgi:alpha-L-fucosidase